MVLDYKKDLKHLYFPAKNKFTVVEVPKMNYLMLDGHGDPNRSQEFQDVTSALYAAAYTIKFALKKQGFEYPVPPLEGLWWTPDMGDFSLERKDLWDWTLMIMQPDGTPEQAVFDGIREAHRKKGLAAVEQIHCQVYDEGLCVQIMYLGAYADEGPTIARLHAFIHENGYELTGKHHEIYLGDPRRSEPDKLKTVIRQPVRRLEHK